MSYSAGDLKWGQAVLGQPSGTITWSADYIDALNFSPSYDEADFDAALLAAFDAWESIANIDFEMAANPGSADVTVVSSPLNGPAGTAYYSYDGNPGLSEIFQGEITFNSNLTWAPEGEGGVDFYAVALHEIGHILGLGHVNDPSEIMNPYIETDVLGDGDVAGAQFLYGLNDGGPPADDPPPDDTPPDDVPVSSGGGGLIGSILAMIFGFLGGGGASSVFAAADRFTSGEEDDFDGPHDDVILLSDIIPMVSVEDHNDHSHDWVEAEVDEPELAWL